jgi:hypothetical protein
MYGSETTTKAMPAEPKAELLPEVSALTRAQIDAKIAEAHALRAQHMAEVGRRVYATLSSLWGRRPRRLTPAAAR